MPRVCLRDTKLDSMKLRLVAGRNNASSLSPPCICPGVMTVPLHLQFADTTSASRLVRNGDAGSSTYSLQRRCYVVGILPGTHFERLTCFLLAILRLARTRRLMPRPRSGANPLVFQQEIVGPMCHWKLVPTTCVAQLTSTRVLFGHDSEYDLKAMVPHLPDAV